MPVHIPTDPLPVLLILLERLGDRWRAVFHLLVHILNACNSEGRLRQMLRTAVRFASSLRSMAVGRTPSPPPLLAVGQRLSSSFLSGSPQQGGHFINAARGGQNLPAETRV